MARNTKRLVADRTLPKLSSLALAVALASGSASSIAEDTLMLEEIIVTAQKRSESLQDVPVAVQAVSADQLQSAGVDGLNYLEQVSSSFTMNDATGFALPYIRGIGSTNQGNGNYNSVATYIDEVYVTRATSGLFSLNSVEQIQVLRGPQGALYGRNATGGALVVTTKTPAPGQEFEGRVTGTLGDYGNRKYGVRVAGGLGDTAAGSLDLAREKRDGFLESLTPGADDLDSKDATSALAKLVFTPADTVSLELSVGYDESDDTAAHGYKQVNSQAIDTNNMLNGIFAANGDSMLTNPQLLLFSVGVGGACGLCTPDQVAQFLTTSPTPPIDPTYNPANAATIGLLHDLAEQAQFNTEFGYVANNANNSFVSTAFPSRLPSDGDTRPGAFSYTENTRAAFKATVEFEHFDLVSITALTDSVYQGNTDVLAADPGTVSIPGFPGENLGFSAIFESESQSQEIRLTSTDSDIEWLVGAYYFHDGGDTVLNGDLFGANFRQADNEFEVESVALFGQIKYALTDAINLTLGARYTDETYELNDRMDGPINQGIALVGIQSVQSVNAVAPGTFPTESDFSKVTGGVILDWTLGDNLLYASVNTGFKSGNLNANNPLSGGVDEEEITAYEVGFKSELADGRIRLNGATFFYDYDNIHIQVISANSGATVLLNGSSAEVLGAEFELLALLSEGLTLNAGLTLLDTEYQEDVPLPGSTTGGVLPIEGNRIAGAVESSMTVGLEYAIPMNNGGEVVFNGNALINGGYFFDPENRVGTGGNSDDGYVTINTNIAYRTDAWDVSVWVNNLTDEEYFRSGNVLNDLSEIAVGGAPRHYGVTVGINF